MTYNANVLLKDDYSNIVSHFFTELWMRANLDIVDEYVAKTLIIESPIDIRIGIDGQKNIARAWFSALSDISVTIDDLIVDGNKVLLKWSSNAMHVGQLCNIPATNKHIFYRGYCLFTLKKDKFTTKIVEYKSVSNIADLFAKYGYLLIKPDKLNIREIKSAIQNVNGVILSDRELEIISLKVCGLSDKQIAAKLNIANKTVENIKYNVSNKLSIKPKKINELLLDLELFNLFFKFGKMHEF